MNKQDDAEQRNAGGDYEVGRNRPPKENQFKKGDAWRGNRHGRPSGSLNHVTIVRRVFGEKLPIVDPETGRKLTGAEAMVIKVRNDSLKGKPHAVRLANEWLQALSALEENREAGELSGNHQEIIEKALERRAKRQEKQKQDV